MLRRKLGAQGPEVSAIGIGAMSFGDFYSPATEDEAHAILDTACALGIDHIDTSNVYGLGQSETAIGTWLKRYGRTSPFRIATKGGIVRDPDSTKRFDNTRAYLEAKLDESLRRLGVEQIALYYIHRRDPDLEIEEVTQTLAGFVKAGKIGAIGFSEIAPTALRRAHAVHPVAAVQSEYSLQTRLPELGIVQTCAELGIALVAFSPVGRGLLTDTPPTPERVAASKFLSTNPRFTGGNLARNIAATAPLRALAQEHGLPTAALAIGWLLSRGETVLPIPGTHQVAHLRDLALGAGGLPADIIARIDQLYAPGWAHGARYSEAQGGGPDQYC